MCSWGSPNDGGKFYKGVPTDTPWNKDLLWRYHVAKETKLMKGNDGEVNISRKTKRYRAPRMKMGITGTFIPDTTPRCYAREEGFQEAGGDTECLSSFTARSQKSGSSAGRSRSSISSSSSRSSYSSRSSSAFTDSSTSSSVRLAQIQNTMEKRAKKAEDKAKEEISVLKRAMAEESMRREAAEKRLNKLYEKLGIEEQAI